MIVISYEKNIAGRGENMIRIGLIGLGTVNTGVYEIVNSRKEILFCWKIYFYGHFARGQQFQ